MQKSLTQGGITITVGQLRDLVDGDTILWIEDEDKRRIMQKYVIYHDGYYFRHFADLPGFGNRPQWTPDIENAKMFDSIAQVNDCLQDHRFGEFRNRCEIQAI